MTLKARWVLAVDRPPLAEGRVTIEGDSIVAVEAGGARDADLDLGEVAILPGLVNAHVHLDLTGMRGAAAPRLPFPDWLRAVIGHRLSTSPERTVHAVRAGLAECIRTGTTLVGDISGDGSSWEILAAAPIRSVVFREVLGLGGERERLGVEAAVRWADEWGATPTCRPGLSPHAPYSTSLSLLRQIVALSGARSLPVATHLGETLEELELLGQQRGPFVSFLQGLGVWRPEALGSLVEWSRELSREDGTGVLVAHGNYLQPEEVPAGATVVYCPRTHAAFGHAGHPCGRFLARGIRVALGTDGLSSNPDLDLLAEARYVRRHSELSGEAIVRMATLSGAEALGFGAETGSLTPGKSADLVVVRLAGSDGEDPYDRVLRAVQPVERVMCRGRWLVGQL